MALDLGLGLDLIRQSVSATSMTPITSWALAADSTYSSDAYAHIFHLTGNDFVYLGFSSNVIKVLRWTGSGYTEVASLNQVMGVADSGFKLTNDTFVWIDHANEDMYVYQVVGSTITQIGSALNLFNFSGNPSGVYLQDNEAIICTGNNAGDAVFQKIEYSGGSITKVGNPFSTTGNFNSPIAMTPTRVAIYDTALDQVQAREFDGTDWNLVGSAYTLGTASAGLMVGCALSETRIVVWVGNNFQALDWNGAKFVEVGPESSVLTASSWNRSMARLSATEFVAHYYGAGGYIKIAQAT